MRADGSEQQEVLTSLTNTWGAVWSPDSRSIALTSDQSGRDEIYTMRLNDKRIVRLTYEGGAYPTWSR
jgi:Tol biopolymer transport system component